MKYSLLLCILICTMSCFAQEERLNVFGGGNSSTSFPMIGVLYQLKQAQIGASIGPFCQRCFNSDFNPNSRQSSASIYFYKHLFGKSQLSHRKPWFVKFVGLCSRFTYERNETLYQGHHYIHFGRDVNFNKRFGLAVSLGPHLEYSPKAGSATNIDYEFYLKMYPTFDINLYYRFCFKE